MIYFPLSGWEGKRPAWAEMLKEPIHQLSGVYTASCGIQQPFGPTALDIHSPVLHGLYTDLLILYRQKTWCHALLHPGSRNRGRGALAPKVHRGGLTPLQTLEGYNIIIMPLSTKAVIQVHKDPLHEYHL